MLKKSSRLLAILAATIALATATGCKDSKSYAELLTIEGHYVNNFLADQRVTNQMPTDTNFVFETGPDAPYYRLDEDGYLYMQVVDPGTKGNYVKNDEVIYFRFTRYNLTMYKDGKLPQGEGNEYDMGYQNAWFRFNNYQLQSSYQWGAGVQTPLNYVPVDAVVNLLVRSQYGFYDEQAYVTPFLFRLRYYRQVS